MERGQFTFYRSFWEAFQALPKKDQLPFITAVCSYALDGESKPISGAANASFLLVKPILDKANKKAKSGKQGGSKTEANKKQNGSKQEAKQHEGEKEKEVEKEKEREIEGEGDYPPIAPPQPSPAVLDYMNRINATPSERSLAELESFEARMGTACCMRAIDIALDEKKPSWNYIRAILRAKLEQGVKCLSDWDRKEAERNARKSDRPDAAGISADERWNIKSHTL